jgi:hypothetical protein
MNQRYLTPAAATAMIGLVFAVAFLPVSTLAFAESAESLRYTSLDPTVSGNPCGTSNYETCPGSDCDCVSSRGSASGDLIGTGYAEFEMAIDLQIVNGCQQFNAALFVVAPKDLQELDFSGMACDTERTFSGSFVLAISQAGHSGSGTFSGRKDAATHHNFVFKFRGSAHNSADDSGM